MIQFACPACQKRYKVSDENAGKTAKCKECGQMMKIPAAPVAVPPAEAPIDAVVSQPVDSQPVVSQPVDSQPAPQAPAAQVPSPQPPAPQPAESPAVAEAAFAAVAPTDSAAPFPTQSPSTAAPSEAASSAQNLFGTTSHLRYEVSQRPDFSIVKIELPQGGKIYSEPSAMVSMSPSVKLEAGFKGGLGKTFGRMLGGESLIINTFTAESGPGEVLFAGGAAGDVAYYRLENRNLFLQRGAYMLNSDGVEVSGKWQGAKGFFSGEGLVLLKASGTGDVFFNSYGAILEIDVTDSFFVDTGYIVAFEDTLQYQVTVLPGLRTGGKIKSFFFGGEGLVCQFTGTGRVWIQTRQVSSFLSWVHPFRPVKDRS